MIKINTLSAIAYNRFIDKDYPTGIEDDGRVFNKALPSESPIKPGSARPMISRSPYGLKEDSTAYAVLDNLAQQGFRVDERFINYISEVFPRGNDKRALWQDAIERTFRGLFRQRGRVIYCDTFFDWRGRVYHMAGEWGSLQNNKLSRAALSAPEPVAVEGEALDYMLKVFEHEGWPTDIKSAKNFLDNPEFDGNGALDWMAVRAALAIVEIASTGKTAYLLEQDANCSGFQHMALLMGDMRLASATNVIVNDKDEDLYMEVAESGNVANLLFGGNARKARQFSKTIVMLTGYGSGAAGIACSYWNDHGGDGELNEDGLFIADPNSTIFIGTKEFTFDELKDFVRDRQKEMLSVFPSIEILRNLCVQYFGTCMNVDASKFGWQTPDGFIALRLITEDEQAKNTVGAAGAMPNLIHSLDAAVVRQVVLNWTSVLGVVHDAFFTTVDKALALQECVQQAYLTVHKNLGDFPIKNQSGEFPQIGKCIGVRR